MNTKRAFVNDIHVNGENPRDVKDKKFKQLVNSLLVFPRMLEIRPIVVDEHMTALGGNQRARALQLIATLTFPDIKRKLAALADFKRYKDAQKLAVLDFWERFFIEPAVDVVDAASLSEEERDQFIIKDNASTGSWDWDKLANKWNTQQLNDWGLDIWNADDAYGDGTEESGGDGEAAQESESPEKPAERTKKSQISITITLNDEAQYSQVLAAIELAVADYDVSLR